MADDAPDAPGPDDPTRAAADAALQAAVGRGELGLAEYEDRSAQVWSASTRAELERLTADLDRPAAATPVAAARPARTQHTVAVFSESTSSGAIEPGGGVAATAVFGRAAVDLRRTDLPERVEVRAVALFGETEVLVPRGAVVHVRGPAVLGSRRADVDAADPGAPVITVTGASVLGSLTVGHGDAAPVGAAVAAAPDRSAGPRRRSPWSVGIAAVGVLAVGYGLVGVATADHATVFGSGTTTVDGPGPVSVSTVFGSYRVVVPDDAQVRTSGVQVFGSTECDVACTPGRTGPVVELDTTGAFGSVQVLTVGEAAQGG